MKIHQNLNPRVFPGKRLQCSVGIHGAEVTTCDTEASSRLLNSAALVIGQTSAAMPLARSTLAVLSAATPSPMWLMFRLAAKFLYASIRRFTERILECLFPPQ